jgi:hypothetical protein
VGTRIDAADLVDGTGGEQQPLGERGLSGVYMRQDAKVEQSGTQASYLPRSSSPAMDMNARRIFAPWSLAAAS